VIGRRVECHRVAAVIHSHRQIGSTASDIGGKEIVRWGRLSASASGDKEYEHGYEL